LRPDEAQIAAAAAFDKVASRVAAFVALRSSARTRLEEADRAAAHTTAASAPAPTPPPLVPRDVLAVGALPRGLYVYGTVGTGKSLLADLFCDEAQSRGLRVARRHFHAFLLGVHSRVRELKASAAAASLGNARDGHIDVKSPERDAFSRAGADLAASTDVFVLDELQVTDVADALILSRVFKALLGAGAALVVTSNRPPRDLYAGGLNREYFLPTIAALEAHCAVIDMSGAACDYRVALASPRAGRLSVGPRAAEQLARALEEAIPGAGAARAEDAQTVTIPLAFGRSLAARSPAPGVALCDFEQLCSKPLGAADFGALARSFRVVAIRDVPRFTRATHNEARRFITLVDELYEARCVVFLAAAVDIHSIFSKLTRNHRGGGIGAAPQPRSDADLVAPRSGPFSNEPLSAEGPNAADYDATDDAPSEDDDDDQDAIYDVAAGRGVALGCFSPHAGAPSSGAVLPNKSSVRPPRRMTVVSAAESAALGELRFACARAVSRLVEMTAAHFEGEVTAAVRARNAAAR
jgi:predicted ATPase